MAKPLRALHLLGLCSLLLLAACAPQTGPQLDRALTDAPKFGKFIWHDLITNDVAAAKRFYGPLMNWSFEDSERPGVGGSYTLIVSASGQYVGGMVPLDDPDDGDDYSRWLSYYAVPDVDAAAAAAVDAGGEILVHPRELGTVARVAAVRDPDGAVVGLATSRAGYPIDQLAIGQGEIAWNELVAAQPAEAAAFYAGLVEGAVREEARSGGVYRFLYAEGKQRAGVMLRPNESLAPLWLTYFGTADSAAASAQVERLGGKVLLAPEPAIRNGSISLAEDPTGAVFGLMKP